MLTKTLIAQALVLAHAAAHPALVGLPPGAILETAAELGLLDAREAATLSEAHALFTGVFHWQRLTIEGRFDAATAPPAILKRLASEANLPDAKRLRAHLDETRARVRALFEKLVGSPLSP